MKRIFYKAKKWIETIFFFFFFFFEVFLIFPTSTAGQKALYYETKLLETITETLLNKTPIKVYVLGYNVNNLYKYAKNLLPVKNPKEADIVIIGDKNSCSSLEKFQKIGIAVGLPVLKNCNFCVVGLYWKKGRPQISFILERLQKFHIRLNKELSFYIISEKDI